MTFHFLVKHWIDTRIAGSEVYHSQLAAYIASKGHTVTHGPKIPSECDTVITTSFPFYHEAARCGKRVIFIQHNENREPYNFKPFSVVYCAHHVKRVCNYQAAQELVFYPFNRYAGMGVNIQHFHFNCQQATLMNCNDNKGGRLLVELAKAMPDINFRGVNGSYGSQRVIEPPKNLLYIDPAKIAMSIYLTTSALLILSKKEGLPTVALEAMSFGIPVVALDIPGTREALGGFVFTSLRAIQCELRELKNDPDYYYARSQASLKRVAEIEAERDWASLDRMLGI